MKKPASCCVHVRSRYRTVKKTAVDLFILIFAALCGFHDLQEINGVAAEVINRYILLGSVYFTHTDAEDCRGNAHFVKNVGVAAAPGFFQLWRQAEFLCGLAGQFYGQVVFTEVIIMVKRLCDYFRTDSEFSSGLPDDIADIVCQGL